MIGADPLHRVGLVGIAEVRVPLHQVQRRPAAEFLDGAEVHAGHDQSGGERMAQDVGRHVG